MVSFKITPIVRSMSILRNANNSSQILGLYLSLPIKVKITKRFGSTDKIIKSVGDTAGKIATQTESAVNSAEASTTSSVQGSNSPLDKAIPPATDIIQEDETDTKSIAMIRSQTSLQSTAAHNEAKCIVNVNLKKDKEFMTQKMGQFDVALEQKKDLAQFFGISNEVFQSESMNKAVNTSYHIDHVNNLLKLLDESTLAMLSPEVIVKWKECFSEYEKMKKGELSFNEVDKKLLEKLC